MRKVEPNAPHAVLLVLDATVGQNALNQVEIFGKIAGVTGLVMTKLDGTARGGILVAIAARFELPVHFVGVGEGVEDLQSFTARDFARAVVGLEYAMSDKKQLNPILKLALDIGPLVLFFAANARFGILPPPAAFMVAVLIALAVSYALTGISPSCRWSPQRSCWCSAG